MPNDIAAIIKEAFVEGFGASETYNDTVLNTPEEAWQTSYALRDALALTAPVATEQAQAVAEALALNPSLHPNSTALVVRFARALSDKLAAAQEKYGYSDGWMRDDWMDECRTKLIDHVAKGDPRDVAAYCAFLWHHGEKTFVPTKAAPYEALMNEVMACGGEVTPREIIFNHATFDVFMQSRKGKTSLDFFADDVESSLAASPEAAPAAMEGKAREQHPDDELLVACITLNGTTLTVEANALADMFGTDDEQHAYELTFKRMTRTAFEALGEFNGF